MNTQEASKKFQLDIKEIRKRKKDGMIPHSYKRKNRIVIPDNTKVIPSKDEVRSFLIDIVKYKNNNKIILPYSVKKDYVLLICFLDFLLDTKYIGEYSNSQNINDIFDSLHLTDKGIDFVLNQNSRKKYCFSLINLSFNSQLGVINIK